jgi:hypothetical protein
MRRGLAWVVAVGLGSALLAGCKEQPENQAGPPYEPLKQKYQSPAASESQPMGPGIGGSGGSGTGRTGGWMPRVPEQGSSDSTTNAQQGPYAIDRPQAMPRERGTAPFGVGAGTDTSRQMAEEQLKTK